MRTDSQKFRTLSTKDFGGRKPDIDLVSGYDDYADWKDWSAGNFGCLTPGQGGYFGRELARFGVEVSGRSVLEMGFGNGSFLSYVSGQGAHVVGVEVQGPLLGRAAEQGLEVYDGLQAAVKNAGDRRFDLIVALDVLEHLSVDELYETLELARTIVADAGRLLVRFPNGDSPFSAPHQYGDRTHRTVIGEGIIRAALERTGWSVAFVGAPASARSSIRKRVQYVVRDACRKMLETTLAFLYYGQGAPPSLAANYVVVAVPEPASGR